MFEMKKLEPRLLNFIEAQKIRAIDRGKAAATAEEEPINVTISHQEYIKPEQEGEKSPVSALDSLAKRVRQSQDSILSTLDELGAKKDVISHTLTNAVTAKLTPRQMIEVTKLDEVKLIRLEAFEDVTCMNESVRVIEVQESWEELGYNGRGVKVAILDSGVDKTHPALFGKVVDEISTSTEPVTVPGNHATHVAGTVASNDAIYRGIAYQADLINIKVLTSSGSGTPQSVIAGLEQAVRRGAQIANLSLGWSEPYHGWVCNDADCILCQAADNAVRLGLTVVVAAGNEGNATANPPYTGMFNIRHPGAAKKVITVGAVDKAKQLASFSSIGPGSGRLSPSSSIRLTKPDLCCTGVGIVSSVLGGGFGGMSGTSMASPHVAGLAALLLQKDPGMKPMTVKKLLEDTCEPLDNTSNAVGYGLVNAYAALIRK